jgi:hypothetical protein
MRQALVFGAGLAGAMLIGHWALWRWWVAKDTVKIEDSLSTELSFVQAVAAVTATFVAGGLGWFAIKEFSEQHERANLQVSARVQQLPGTTQLFRREKDKFSSTEVIFDLTNQGPVIARWFMIHLELPFLTEVWNANNPDEQTTFSGPVRTKSHEFLQEVIAERYGNAAENWKPGITFSDKGYCFGISFLSQGQYAAYPHQQIDLLVCKFGSWMITKDAEFTCKYTIYTENDNPVTGSLTVHIPAAIDATATQNN